MGKRAVRAPDTHHWIERVRGAMAHPRLPDAVSLVLIVLLGWQLAGLTWAALRAPANARIPAATAVASAASGGTMTGEAPTALSPLSVTDAAKRDQRGGAAAIGPGLRISGADLALFSRRLATLVQSGMPVEEAVRAGEQSGHLGGVLERLADYTEERRDTRGSVTAARAYPLILTVAALAIVIALLTYVVPQVVGVFDTLEAELPLLTLIGAVIGFRLALRSPCFRYRFHALLLRVPVIGRLLRDADTGRFARTVSILAGSGVPVLEALSIASTVIGNRPLRQAVERAAVQVREGGALNRSLETSGRFPPMFLHLIAIGKESGQLDSMLRRAADYQERTTKTTIPLLVNIFEPALILVMGVIVLLIVLAILLPIFELNQLVG